MYICRKACSYIYIYICICLFVVAPAMANRIEKAQAMAPASHGATSAGRSVNNYYD